MQTAITLHDLLRIILYVAGAGVLIYLTLVLKNVLKIVNEFGDLLENNHKIFDDTIKKIPQLTDNAVEITDSVNVISKDTEEIITKAKPEVEKMVKAAGNVSETVDEITRTVDTTNIKIQQTVSNVTDTIDDTVKTISVNMNNVMDYFYVIKEVMNSVKQVFFSK